MSILAMETISERQNLRRAEEFDKKFAETKKRPNSRQAEEPLLWNIRQEVSLISSPVFVFALGRQFRSMRERCESSVGRAAGTLPSRKWTFWLLQTERLMVS